MKFKKLILLFALMIPVVVNGAIYTNYSTSVDGVNKYLPSKSDAKIYFYDSDELTIPFGFDENGVKVDSKFKNGGLLNKHEYDIIGGKESYLYDSNEYFTMTSAGSGKVYIVSDVDNKSINETDTSATRITGHVKSHINVKGKGTYTEPWEFIKTEYNIQIDVVKAKINGKNEFSETINVDYANYTILPENYTVYKQMTCDGIFDYTYKDNKLSFTNIQTDVNCSIEYETAQYEINFKGINASVAEDKVVVEKNGNREVRFTPKTYHALTNVSCTNGLAYTYDYKTHIFTVKNVTNSSTCTLTYTDVSKNFAYSTSVQTYTVQSDGNYNIKLYGAQGAGSGGKGGLLNVTMYLQKGQVLNIMTGGSNGHNGGGTGQYRGGGSTTVTLNGKIILAGAGGGGGSAGTAGGNGTGAGGATVGSGAGGAGTNGGGGGSSYDHQYQANCSSCYYGHNTCVGKTIYYNCSDCYTGSNTCKSGCDSVYDSCATGSNTCKAGYKDTNCSSCYYGSPAVTTTYYRYYNTSSRKTSTPYYPCSSNPSCDSFYYPEKNKPYKTYSACMEDHSQAYHTERTGACANRTYYHFSGGSWSSSAKTASVIKWYFYPFINGKTFTDYAPFNGYATSGWFDSNPGGNYVKTSQVYYLVTKASTCSYGCDSVYSSCATGSNTCKGGYVESNCSSCYTGSNTCASGCDSYYDSCYTGENTCSYGCDTLTKPYKSGYGGKNIVNTTVISSTTTSGANTGNGKAEIKYVN